MTEQVVSRVNREAVEKISYEEFLRLYDSQHAEWTDGEVTLMSPVSSRHDDLSFYLRLLLTVYLSHHPLGKLKAEPYSMKFNQDRYGREPDLMFVANEHLERLLETHLDGPADVAIEIISPGSIVRDRGEKFNEYEMGGVREYWIIDPLRKEALFYGLADDGLYHALPIRDDGNFHSNVIAGFGLHVATLWRDALPDITEISEIVQKMLLC